MRMCVISDNVILSSRLQAAAARVPAVRAEFEKHKKRYEHLRFDLDIKMKLLDENRV